MPDDSASGEPRYVWFPATTVRQLKAQLNTASDEAILKVVGHGEKMTLEVLEPDAKVTDNTSGPLNDAHQCPPACIG